MMDMLYQDERYEDVIMLYTLAQEYLLDNSQNIITSVFAALYQQVRTARLFPAILGKGSWPKLGKNDRLNIKIGRN